MAEEKAKEAQRNEEKNALDLGSVDGIAWVSERWGEIEALVSILSLKVREITKEDFLPETFIMETDTKSIVLVYDGGRKSRKFPMEILLVMNDQAVFSRLAEMYIQIIDSGMFDGNLPFPPPPPSQTQMSDVTSVKTEMAVD